jgi:hypothetical protein
MLARINNAATPDYGYEMSQCEISYICKIWPKFCSGRIFLILYLPYCALIFYIKRNLIFYSKAYTNCAIGFNFSETLQIFVEVLRSFAKKRNFAATTYESRYSCQIIIIVITICCHGINMCNAHTVLCTLTFVADQN